MSPSAAGGTAAVLASAPLTFTISDFHTTAVSVVVGLVGVWLARIVFVDRENRRLQRRQSFRETAPVTAIAMLVVAAIVQDRHIGISMAAFTGLGVGWTTVMLLDIIGERVMRVLRTMLGADPLPPGAKPADHSGLGGEMTNHERDTPDEMARFLAQPDEASPKD
jgi:F0F1-type ATP synthase assembly protein I